MFIKNMWNKSYVRSQLKSKASVHNYVRDFRLNIRFPPITTFNRQPVTFIWIGFHYQYLICTYIAENGRNVVYRIFHWNYKVIGCTSSWLAEAFRRHVRNYMQDRSRLNMKIPSYQYRNSHHKLSWSQDRNGNLSYEKTACILESGLIRTM